MSVLGWALLVSIHRLFEDATIVMFIVVSLQLKDVFVSSIFQREPVWWFRPIFISLDLSILTVTIMTLCIFEVGSPLILVPLAFFYLIYTCLSNFLIY